MELLREENMRLKELLKLNNREVMSQIEPTVAESEHANVDEDQRNDETKDTTVISHGMDHSSKNLPYKSNLPVIFMKWSLLTRWSNPTAQIHKKVLVWQVPSLPPSPTLERTF